MSLYLEPVSSALSEAVEWGRVGGGKSWGDGCLQEADAAAGLASLPHSPGSEQAVQNRATGEEAESQVCPRSRRKQPRGRRLGRIPGLLKLANEKAEK